MTGLVHQTEHLGHVLTREDITLYYEIHGTVSGIPLFVLHGGPGFDHAYLEVSPVWRDLAAHRPVIFYDQRGTGRSSKLAAGQSCGLVDQLSDLDALRQHLGFEHVDLLGHSWGGFLAMAYSARYPQYVRRLILVDSAAPKRNTNVTLFKDVFPEVVVRQNALAFRVELGDKDAIRADIQEYFSMLFYAEQKRDAFLSVADSFIYRPEVSQMLAADASRFDLRPELTKFHLPTLVITGRYDMNLAPVVAYEIHKAIAGSRSVVFEQSGHLPFFEEPDKFLSTVDQFLSED